MCHGEGCAENVGMEGGRVALRGLLRHRTGLAFGSGSVNSHIQATEARHGLIDQVSYVVLVAYIGIHVFRLRVESPKFSHQILAGFVASTRDNDARTLFREGQGGGSSDARQGASDQNNGGIHGETPWRAIYGSVVADVADRLNMDVRIISVKRSFRPAKTDSP